MRKPPQEESNRGRANIDHKIVPGTPTRMSLPPTDFLEAEFARLNRLRFSASVEARFDAEVLDQRKRIGRIALVVGILIYDATIVTDWQVIPDMVGWLAFLRLGVFTAMALLILWAMPRMKAVWQIDSMMAAGGIVCVLLPATAMVFSQSEHVLVYQFGSMLTLTYFTLVNRLRFRIAAIGLAMALVVQLACVALRLEIDATDFGFVVNFFLSGAVLLLMGSFILERFERKSFLERLRGELLLEQIEKTARTDPLTGLSNRHHLVEVAEKIAAETPDEAFVAAIMIDIDHFKRLNDTQGHLAGDRCIRAVADTIHEVLDNQGGAGLPVHAFRFGGEEFLLLLPRSDARHAATLGEAIRRSLAAKRIAHPAMGEGAIVTVSMGAAHCHAASFSLDALADAADGALYRAKQQGRNRLAIAA